MKVNELSAKQGNVNIELDILDVGQAREFQKFGKPGRVANAIAKDETGDVKITLWNDEIERVKGGDKVMITNGYVSEWQGELQVSTGRFGKIEVVGESGPAPEKGTSPIHHSAPKHAPASKPAAKKDDDGFESGPIDDEEDVI